MRTPFDYQDHAEYNCIKFKLSDYEEKYHVFLLEDVLPRIRHYIAESNKMIYLFEIKAYIEDSLFTQIYFKQMTNNLSEREAFDEWQNSEWCVILGFFIFDILIYNNIAFYFHEEQDEDAYMQMLYCYTKTTKEYGVGMKPYTNLIKSGHDIAYVGQVYWDNGVW